MHGRDPRGRRRREDGQGTVEYSLLIATGALLIVVAMLFMAGGVDRLFRKTGDEVGAFRPPAAVCEVGYQGVCLPPAPPDLSCDDVIALGVPVPVSVVGSDPHGLDPDGNGLGCEP